MATMMHGGRLVAKALKAEGTQCLFTLCGGHIQSIYDGCLDEGIRVVDTRHEQTSAHAADGWARATGTPGVCAITAGPGVTDAVTAVANAYRAGVPMIVFGGAGPRVFTHMGSLQDMDHVELMRPITKWSGRVDEARRLAEYVSIAFRKATTGVPGPVFIEVPLDVLMEFVDADQVPLPSNYRTHARPAPDPKYLDQAIEMLQNAQRPVCVVGSQIRWSRHPQETLDAFVEATGIPTYVNGMARGLMNPQSPHFRNRSRRDALKQTDLLLLLGTPFDFRLGYGQSQPIQPGTQSGQAGTLMLRMTQPVIHPDAKIIQVDLDGDEVGRNRTNGVDVGLIGDSGLVLDAITKAMTSTQPAQWEDWQNTVQEAEEKKWGKMRAEMANDSDPPNPLRVCNAVNHFLRPGDIVVGDGGDFVATAAYVLKPHGLGTWMDPGPLGTLGVGPGYAMAAQLAHPDRRVIIMYGDGSFGLNGMEFEAMARQNIPVVGVVGNDAGWTQILRGQKELYGKDRLVATQLDYTRYDQVVEALGCHGEYVETCDALMPALQRAFDSGKPALVNVKIASSSFRQGSISV